MSTTTQTTGSLAGALVPAKSIATDLGLIGAGAALTAVAAQVTVPWQPVPFTLQTLAVAICGLSLGARRGALSQVAYLAAGTAGAPIFAQGKLGFPLLYPTGGYLMGFVLAAWILGFLADRGWDRKVVPMVGAMTLAMGAIYTLGVAWLCLYFHQGIAFGITNGFLPFAGAEAVKAVVAVLAMPAAWWLLGKRK